jgi:hypothetical protein
MLLPGTRALSRVAVLCDRKLPSETNLQLAKALLPYVAPIIVGALLGYRFPRADLGRLLAPGVVLAFAAWVIFGWMGVGAAGVDLSRSGRVFVWLALLLLMLGLWAAGALVGKWARMRRSP